MPNKLREGTLRVSYVESKLNNKAITLLAGAKGVTISALIRQAVVDFLKKEDPSGETIALAKHLIEKQSDSPDERVVESLDLATLERLKKIAMLGR